MRCYVIVKFKGSTNKYTYTADGADEELGDFTHAVVESPIDGMCVTDVVNVSVLDESSYEGQYKDVIAIFDVRKYKQSLATGIRKKAIEKELRARIAKRSIEKNFEDLLKDDEEGLKLLSEFKSL